jgi:MFS family permease
VTTRTTPRDPVLRARVAVAGVFALHGAVTGSFAARIPWVQDHLGLSPGALGIALLMPALGAVGSMPFAGHIIHRLGSRAATRWLIPVWCGGLALPALAPSLPALCVVMLGMGVAAGLSDVAMNAQGVAVEQRLGRSVMSGLHGMWSVGGLVGSGVGVLAAHAGIDARAQLSATAVVLVAIGLVVGRNLLEVPPSDAEEPPRFALPTRPVLLIGLVGFCAIFAEGSAADWCAVYLKRVTGADAAVAAAAYTTFALMMASGRLCGDAVVNRLGAATTVRIGGVLATLGGVVVVASRSAPPALAGFALIGLGLAVVVPLAFAAAGHASAHPGQAIAAVATIAYGAGLAAPAIVGGIAQVSSLPVSFAVTTGLTSLIVVGAGALAPRPSAPVAEPVADVRAGW